MGGTGSRPADGELDGFDWSKLDLSGLDGVSQQPFVSGSAPGIVPDGNFQKMTHETSELRSTINSFLRSHRAPLTKKQYSLETHKFLTQFAQKAAVLWPLKRTILSDEDIRLVHAGGEAGPGPENRFFEFGPGESDSAAAQSSDGAPSADDIREAQAATDALAAGLGGDLQIPLGMLTALLRQRPELSSEAELHRLGVLFAFLIQSMQEHLLVPGGAADSPAGATGSSTGAANPSAEAESISRGRSKGKREGKSVFAAAAAVAAGKSKDSDKDAQASGASQAAVADSPVVREVLLFCRRSIADSIAAARRAHEAQNQPQVEHKSSDSSADESDSASDEPVSPLGPAAVEFFAQAVGGSLTAAASSGALSQLLAWVNQLLELLPGEGSGEQPEAALAVLNQALIPAAPPLRYLAGLPATECETKLEATRAAAAAQTARAQAEAGAEPLAPALPPLRLQYIRLIQIGAPGDAAEFDSFGEDHHEDSEDHHDDMDDEESSDVEEGDRGMSFGLFGRDNEVRRIRAARKADAGGNGLIDCQFPEAHAMAAGGGFCVAAVPQAQAPLTWGSGLNSELGTARRVAFQSVPVHAQLPGNRHFQRVAAGTYHGLAITQDGMLFSWGSPGPKIGHGQHLPAPVSAPRDIRWRDCAAGSQFSAALDQDGRLYVWGDGPASPYGRPEPCEYPGAADLLPVRHLRHQLKRPGVASEIIDPTGRGLVRFERVAAADALGLALDRDGKLWAWGSLGGGSPQLSSVPSLQHVPDAEAAESDLLRLEDTVVSVVAGGSTVIALTDRGLPYVWSTAGFFGGCKRFQKSPAAYRWFEWQGHRVVSAACHDDGAAFVTQDGQVWVVGHLGEVHSPAADPESDPVPVQLRIARMPAAVSWVGMGGSFLLLGSTADGTAVHPEIARLTAAGLDDAAAEASPSSSAASSAASAATATATNSDSAAALDVSSEALASLDQQPTAQELRQLQLPGGILAHPALRDALKAVPASPAASSKKAGGSQSSAAAAAAESSAAAAASREAQETELVRRELSAPRPADLWLVLSNVGIGIRTTPEVGEHNRSGEDAMKGSVVAVSEVRPTQETCFLRLADGRGWIFDYKNGMQLARRLTDAERIPFEAMGGRPLAPIPGTPKYKMRDGSWQSLPAELLPVLQPLLGNPHMDMNRAMVPRFGSVRIRKHNGGFQLLTEGGVIPSGTYPIVIEQSKAGAKQSTATPAKASRAEFQRQAPLPALLLLLGQLDARAEAVYHCTDTSRALVEAGAPLPELPRAPFVVDLSRHGLQAQLDLLRAQLRPLLSRTASSAKPAWWRYYMALALFRVFRANLARLTATKASSLAASSSASASASSASSPSSSSSSSSSSPAAAGVDAVAIPQQLPGWGWDPENTTARLSEDRMTARWRSDADGDDKCSSLGGFCFKPNTGVYRWTVRLDRGGSVGLGVARRPMILEQHFNSHPNYNNCWMYYAGGGMYTRGNYLETPALHDSAEVTFVLDTDEGRLWVGKDNMQMPPADGAPAAVAGPPGTERMSLVYANLKGIELYPYHELQSSDEQVTLLPAPLEHMGNPGRDALAAHLAAQQKSAGAGASVYAGLRQARLAEPPAAPQHHWVTCSLAADPDFPGSRPPALRMSWRYSTAGHRITQLDADGCLAVEVDYEPEEGVLRFLLGHRRVALSWRPASTSVRGAVRPMEAGAPAIPFVGEVACDPPFVPVASAGDAESRLIARWAQAVKSSSSKKAKDQEQDGDDSSEEEACSFSLFSDDEQPEQAAVVAPPVPQDGAKAPELLRQQSLAAALSKDSHCAPERLAAAVEAPAAPDAELALAPGSPFGRDSVLDFLLEVIRRTDPELQAESESGPESSGKEDGEDEAAAHFRQQLLEAAIHTVAKCLPWLYRSRAQRLGLLMQLWRTAFGGNPEASHPGLRSRRLAQTLLAARFPAPAVYGVVARFVPTSASAVAGGIFSDASSGIKPVSGISPPPAPSFGGFQAISPASSSGWGASAEPSQSLFGAQPDAGSGQDPFRTPQRADRSAARKGASAGAGRSSARTYPALSLGHPLVLLGFLPDLLQAPGLPDLSAALEAEIKQAEETEEALRRAEKLQAERFKGLVTTATNDLAAGRPASAELEPRRLVEGWKQLVEKLREMAPASAAAAAQAGSQSGSQASDVLALAQSMAEEAQQEEQDDEAQLGEIAESLAQQNWSCAACTFLNEPNPDGGAACMICETPRPDVFQEAREKVRATREEARAAREASRKEAEAKAAAEAQAKAAAEGQDVDLKERKQAMLALVKAFCEEEERVRMAAGEARLAASKQAARERALAAAAEQYAAAVSTGYWQLRRQSRELAGLLRLLGSMSSNTLATQIAAIKVQAAAGDTPAEAKSSSGDEAADEAKPVSPQELRQHSLQHSVLGLLRSLVGLTLGWVREAVSRHTQARRLRVQVIKLKQKQALGSGAVAGVSAEDSEADLQSWTGAQGSDQPLDPTLEAAAGLLQELAQLAISSSLGVLRAAAQLFPEQPEEGRGRPLDSRQAHALSLIGESPLTRALGPLLTAISCFGAAKPSDAEHGLLFRLASRLSRTHWAGLKEVAELLERLAAPLALTDELQAQLRLVADTGDRAQQRRAQEETTRKRFRDTRLAGLKEERAGLARRLAKLKAAQEESSPDQQQQEQQEQLKQQVAQIEARLAELRQLGVEGSSEETSAASGKSKSKAAKTAKAALSTKGSQDLSEACTTLWGWRLPRSSVLVRLAWLPDLQRLLSHVQLLAAEEESPELQATAGLGLVRAVSKKYRALVLARAAYPSWPAHAQGAAGDSAAATSGAQSKAADYAAFLDRVAAATAPKPTAAASASAKAEDDSKDPDDPENAQEAADAAPGVAVAAVAEKAVKVQKQPKEQQEDAKKDEQEAKQEPVNPAVAGSAGSVVPAVAESPAKPCIVRFALLDAAEAANVRLWVVGENFQPPAAVPVADTSNSSDNSSENKASQPVAAADEQKQSEEKSSDEPSSAADAADDANASASAIEPDTEAEQALEVLRRQLDPRLQPAETKAAAEAWLGRALVRVGLDDGRDCKLAARLKRAVAGGDELEEESESLPKGPLQLSRRLSVHSQQLVIDSAAAAEFCRQFIDCDQLEPVAIGDGSEAPDQVEEQLLSPPLAAYVFLVQHCGKGLVGRRNAWLDRAVRAVFVAICHHHGLLAELISYGRALQKIPSRSPRGRPLTLQTHASWRPVVPELHGAWLEAEKIRGFLYGRLQPMFGNLEALGVAGGKDELYERLCGRVVRAAHFLLGLSPSAETVALRDPRSPAVLARLSATTDRPVSPTAASRRWALLRNAVRVVRHLRSVSQPQRRARLAQRLRDQTPYAEVSDFFRQAADARLEPAALEQAMLERRAVALERLVFLGRLRQLLERARSPDSQEPLVWALLQRLAGGDPCHGLEGAGRSVLTRLRQVWHRVVLRSAQIAAANRIQLVESVDASEGSLRLAAGPVGAPGLERCSMQAFLQRSMALGVWAVRLGPEDRGLVLRSGILPALHTQLAYRGGPEDVQEAVPDGATEFSLRAWNTLEIIALQLAQPQPYLATERRSRAGLELPFTPRHGSAKAAAQTPTTAASTGAEAPRSSELRFVFALLRVELQRCLAGLYAEVPAAHEAWSQRRLAWDAYQAETQAADQLRKHLAAEDHQQEAACPGCSRLLQNLQRVRRDFAAQHKPSAVPVHPIVARRRSYWVTHLDRILSLVRRLISPSVPSKAPVVAGAQVGSAGSLPATVAPAQANAEALLALGNAHYLVDGDGGSGLDCGWLPMLLHILEDPREQFSLSLRVSATTVLRQVLPCVEPAQAARLWLDPRGEGLAAEDAVAAQIKDGQLVLRRLFAMVSSSLWPEQKDLSLAKEIREQYAAGVVSGAGAGAASGSVGDAADIAAQVQAELAKSPLVPEEPELTEACSKADSGAQESTPAIPELPQAQDVFGRLPCAEQQQWAEALQASQLRLAESIRPSAQGVQRKASGDTQEQLNQAILRLLGGLFAGDESAIAGDGTEDQSTSSDDEDSEDADEADGSDDEDEDETEESPLDPRLRAALQRRLELSRQWSAAVSGCVAEAVSSLAAAAANAADPAVPRAHILVALHIVGDQQASAAFGGVQGNTGFAASPGGPCHGAHGAAGDLVLHPSDGSGVLPVESYVSCLPDTAEDPAANRFEVGPDGVRRLRARAAVRRARLLRPLLPSLLAGFAAVTQARFGSRLRCLEAARMGQALPEDEEDLEAAAQALVDAADQDENEIRLPEVSERQLEAQFQALAGSLLARVLAQMADDPRTALELGRDPALGDLLGLASLPLRVQRGEIDPNGNSAGELNYWQSEDGVQVDLGLTRQFLERRRNEIWSSFRSRLQQAQRSAAASWQKARTIRSKLAADDSKQPEEKEAAAVAAVAVVGAADDAELDPDSDDDKENEKDSEKDKEKEAEPIQWWRLKPANPRRWAVRPVPSRKPGAGEPTSSMWPGALVAVEKLVPGLDDPREVWLKLAPRVESHLKSSARGRAVRDPPIVPGEEYVLSQYVDSQVDPAQANNLGWEPLTEEEARQVRVRTFKLWPGNYDRWNIRDQPTLQSSNVLDVAYEHDRVQVVDVVMGPERGRPWLRLIDGRFIIQKPDGDAGWLEEPQAVTCEGLRREARERMRWLRKNRALVRRVVLEKQAREEARLAAESRKAFPEHLLDHPLLQLGASANGSAKAVLSQPQPVVPKPTPQHPLVVVEGQHPASWGVGYLYEPAEVRRDWLSPAMAHPASLRPEPEPAAGPDDGYFPDEHGEARRHRRRFHGHSSSPEELVRQRLQEAMSCEMTDTRQLRSLLRWALCKPAADDQQPVVGAPGNVPIAVSPAPASMPPQHGFKKVGLGFSQPAAVAGPAAAVAQTPGNYGELYPEVLAAPGGERLRSLASGESLAAAQHAYAMACRRFGRPLRALRQIDDALAVQYARLAVARILGSSLQLPPDALEDNNEEVNKEEVNKKEAAQRKRFRSVPEALFKRRPGAPAALLRFFRLMAFNPSAEHSWSPLSPEVLAGARSHGRWFRVMPARPPFSVEGTDRQLMQTLGQLLRQAHVQEEQQHTGKPAAPLTATQRRLGEFARQLLESALRQLEAAAGLRYAGIRWESPTLAEAQLQLVRRESVRVSDHWLAAATAEESHEQVADAWYQAELEQLAQPRLRFADAVLQVLLKACPELLVNARTFRRLLACLPPACSLESGNPQLMERVWRLLTAVMLRARAAVLEPRHGLPVLARQVSVTSLQQQRQENLQSLGAGLRAFALAESSDEDEDEFEAKQELVSDQGVDEVDTLGEDADADALLRPLLEQLPLEQLQDLADNRARKENGRLCSSPYLVSLLELLAAAQECKEALEEEEQSNTPPAAVVVPASASASSGVSSADVAGAEADAEETPMPAPSLVVDTLGSDYVELRWSSARPLPRGLPAPPDSQQALPTDELRRLDARTAQLLRETGVDELEFRLEMAELGPDGPKQAGVDEASLEWREVYRGPALSWHSKVSGAGHPEDHQVSENDADAAGGGVSEEAADAELDQPEAVVSLNPLHYYCFRVRQLRRGVVPSGGDLRPEVRTRLQVNAEGQVDVRCEVRPAAGSSRESMSPGLLVQTRPELAWNSSLEDVEHPLGFSVDEDGLTCRRSVKSMGLTAAYVGEHPLTQYVPIAGVQGYTSGTHSWTVRIRHVDPDTCYLGVTTESTSSSAQHPGDRTTFSAGHKNRVVQALGLDQAALGQVGNTHIPIENGDVWTLTLSFEGAAGPSHDSLAASQRRLGLPAPPAAMASPRSLYMPTGNTGRRPGAREERGGDHHSGRGGRGGFGGRSHRSGGSGGGDGPSGITLSATRNGEPLGVIIPSLPPLAPGQAYYPLVSFVNPEDYVSLVPELGPEHARRTGERMRQARLLLDTYNQLGRQDRPVPFRLLEQAYGLWGPAARKAHLRRLSSSGGKLGDLTVDSRPRMLHAVAGWPEELRSGQFWAVRESPEGAEIAVEIAGVVQADAQRRDRQLKSSGASGSAGGSSSEPALPLWVQPAGRKTAMRLERPEQLVRRLRAPDLAAGDFSDEDRAEERRRAQDPVWGFLARPPHRWSLSQFVRVLTPYQWSRARDASLVQLAQQIADRLQLSSPHELLLSALGGPETAEAYPLLRDVDPWALRARFCLLRHVNRCLELAFPHLRLGLEHSPDLELADAQLHAGRLTGSGGPLGWELARQVFRSREILFTGPKRKLLTQLLQATETFSRPPTHDILFGTAENLAQIQLDRRRARAAREFAAAAHAGTLQPEALETAGQRLVSLRNDLMFGQSRSLFDDNQHPERLRRAYVKAALWDDVVDNQPRTFKVTFADEKGKDEGGPYRVCFSEWIAEVLSETPLLPLFIPSVNKATHAMEENSNWVPNPVCGRLDLYRRLGKQIGVAIRCGVPLGLRLPNLFWKRLVQQAARRSDLAQVDAAQAQLLESIEELGRAVEQTRAARLASASPMEASPEERRARREFRELLRAHLQTRFVTRLSDGTELELLPNGRRIRVTPENHRLFVSLCQRRRLDESGPQIDAILSGIGSVVPLTLLPLFSHQELEELVAGRDEIDVDALRRDAVYPGPPGKLDPSEPVVQYFWEVMESFEQRDREQFLQFVSGSRRPLVGERLRISWLGDKERPDDWMPQASTCFFILLLPKYTNPEALRVKLRKAMYNCTTMDLE